jgi:small subunit ribosomal protein S16
MVKIRLMRMGAKKRPFYRVVVADSRSPRDGRFIENIGKYHPLSHPSVIEIDEERALHWLRSGAQPTDPARVLLQKTGVWSRFTGEPAPPPMETSPAPAQGGEASDSPPLTRGVGSDESSASSDGTAEASPEGTPLVPEGDTEAATGQEQPEEPDEAAPATREEGQETP